MTTINISNDGASSYLIDGVSNGNISLVRGNTYNLVINASGHPFEIRTLQGVALTTDEGVTNNGTESGTITYVVPYDAPDELYYICTYHSNMTGTINITGLVNPSLSGFSIPTKTVGDSSFTITAPTSNSDGAFTYTSSNQAVATISDNTITIIGDGTSTITATQASTSTYTSGTITASFQVNAATPITPSLSGFSIPTKTVGDSSFTITAPTSNSDGAFSYSSSNGSVATISDNTITIVGAGTSTITATQASTSTYTSGTITASFQVNAATVCLTNPSIVNIIASNGNKYVFNNSSSYDSNIVYGLGIGTYVLKNISEAHPMALLNNGKTSMVTYSGDSGKKLTKSVDGVSYDFYYGDITVQVNGDFGIISVYCYYHGYMGGLDLLKYSSSCYITNVVCFSEDAKILCYRNKKEEYVCIKDIRKGELVKTYAHGYVKVDMIGHSKIHHLFQNDYKNQLFRLTPANYSISGLFEDLILTGCHSILVKTLTYVQKEKTKKFLGNIYITDDYYRLMAGIDENTILLEKEGVYPIWHFALENQDYYKNYGVYANGLLVESCSKRMMKEYSGMTLL